MDSPAISKDVHTGFRINLSSPSNGTRMKIMIALPFSFCLIVMTRFRHFIDGSGGEEKEIERSMLG